MELDYVKIFNVFVDVVKSAMPISIFLYFIELIFHFFFKLAFPKRKEDF